MAQLLPLVFQDWPNHGSEIAFRYRHWFDEDWLDMIWEYLQKYFRNDLSKFDSLPLLPVGPQGGVLRLNRTAAIVSRTDSNNRAQLHADLASVCNSLGIKVIDMSKSEALKHSRIFDYVLPPNETGVLQAIVRQKKISLGIDYITAQFTALPDKVKVGFRGFFAKGSVDNCSAEERELLSC